MSDAVPPTVPPGWYPDAAGTTRWWSGSEWTEHTAQAQAQAPAGMVRVRPAIPADRPIYPVWIWLIVLLPLLTYGLFLTWRPGLDYAALSSPDTITTNPFSVYTDLFTPGYFAIIGSSWLVYGLSVFFASRDVLWLRKQGVERPFAWPFAFLGGLVYIIGRSVIVRQVAKPRGLAPIWVTIGVVVVGVIVSTLWSLLIFQQMVQQISQIAGVPTT